MLSRILTGLLNGGQARTNQEHLDSINFPHFKIPQKYLCRYTGRLLDNPVALEDEQGDFDQDRIVDKAWVQAYWEKNDNNNYYLNPFTGQHLKFQPLELVELKAEIDALVKEQVRLHELGKQLDALNRRFEGINAPVIKNASFSVYISFWQPASDSHCHCIN